MSSSKYVADEGEVEAKESPDETKTTMAPLSPAKIGGNAGGNKSLFAKMEELGKCCKELATSTIVPKRSQQ